MSVKKLEMDSVYVLPACVKTLDDYTIIIKSENNHTQKIKTKMYKCECRHCTSSGDTTKLWKNGEEQPLISHLVEHSKKNRGFFMFSCPLCKDHNTFLPSIPSDIYNHIKLHHPEWIDAHKGKKKGYFPVIYCKDCKELTTYQHKHCFFCPNTAGGYKYFKTKNDLDYHLLRCHPK
ncbi:hypothetical protein CPAV1605_1099 [seawater metagenome]|uniref:Uncharacterized protein n=1 Tax=seawater metagenome TaxID=1561972 RepID=A0A5E8CIZ3_9ZZZZ